MITSMLKAVHKMLEDGDKAKVECARDVIHELISHLEGGEAAIAVDSSLDPEAQQAQKDLMG